MNEDEITTGLQELMRRDFQFAHPHDSDGALVAVVGIRAHNNVIDIIQLRGPDEAEAARVPGDEPNVLSPNTVLWRTAGAAPEVIQEMLNLADPAIEPTTIKTKGCWVPARTGQQRWLAASA